jgi:2,4-dienoyl-CoA reductase-like NADH-dependent reductase (Old Yellow Enzyme family)
MRWRPVLMASAARCQYLINQFIDSQANQRTDGYGGALQNRLRFLREVVQAVMAVAGVSASA